MPVAPLALPQVIDELPPMKTALVWQLVWLLSSVQLIADEVLITAFRKQIHEQAGTALSSPVPSTYLGLVTVRDAGRFSFAAWEPPSRLQYSLSRVGGQWELVEQRSSAASLHSFLPQGLHRVYARLGDAWLEADLNLGPLQLPSPPVISNYLELQSVPAGAAWTLRWDRWEAAMAADKIEVRLWRWDDLYEATEIPVFTISGGNALPGDATSAVLEPSLLPGERPYSVEVSFVRLDTERLQSGLIPARLAAGDVSATRALIRKSTEAGPEPTLSFSVSTTTAVDFPLAPLWSMAPAFPASIQSSVRLAVTDTQAVPPLALIFNGPQQTLSDTPASRVESTPSGHRYQTAMGTIDYPPSGRYSAIYRAVPYTFEVTAVPTASQHRLPVISVEMANGPFEGEITAFTVAWRDAAGATVPPPAEAGAAHWYDDNGNTLALVSWEATQTARIELLQPVPITWLSRVVVEYTTPDGNRIAAEFELYPSVRGARDYLRPAGLYLNDWIRVLEFGWLQASGWPWAWHAEHGWIYFEGGGFPHRLYFDRYLGWTWTATFITPHYYSYSRGEWLLFASGTRTPERWFYSYKLGRWFNESESPTPALRKSLIR